MAAWGSGGSWDRTEPLSDQTKREAVQAIRTALDEGINFFDHADIYCWGKSEEAFAAIWSEVPHLREKIIVQSKCGIVMEGARPESTVGQFDFSYEHITRSVEGSLKRLQTDYLDVLLLHRPDPLVEPEEVARAFDRSARQRQGALLRREQSHGGANGVLEEAPQSAASWRINSK